MSEALQLPRDDVAMPTAARSAQLRRAQLAQLMNAVTSITVLPQQVPQPPSSGLAALAARLRGDARQQARRAPTGARVTLEFASDARLPAMQKMRICYDFAENGGWRECIGIPELTHTTRPAGREGLQYHYRLSHWIAAPQIMCFVER